jgi:hypothetical protein
MRHVTTSDTNLRRFFGNGFALPLSLKNPTHFLESLLQSTLSAFSRVKFQHQNAYKMEKKERKKMKRTQSQIALVYKVTYSMAWTAMNACQPASLSLFKCQSAFQIRFHVPSMLLSHFLFNLSFFLFFFFLFISSFLLCFKTLHDCFVCCSYNINESFLNF